MTPSGICHIKMNRKADNTLKDIFYNIKNPAVYGTSSKLKKQLHFRDKKNITNKKIKEWLLHQKVITLHKQPQNKFNRNHYTVFAIDQLWEVDLCDMSSFAKQNDGYKFILSVIDVFSKYGWMVPLKNKTGIEVTRALRKIINSSERTPANIQSDKGREFKNSTLKEFLASKNIKQNFPYTQSLQKAAVVERFNRTMKEKMFKYFTHRGKTHRRYVDDLQDLVNSYNNSKHGTIKMAPADVTARDTVKIFENTKKSYKTTQNKVAQLEIGDFVRIIRKKNALEHAYTEKWTRELFRINQVIEKKPFPLYKLVDLKGKQILGKFYEQQLQKVLIHPHAVVKIIKTRGLGKNIQYYVETANKTTQWVDQQEYNSRKI